MVGAWETGGQLSGAISDLVEFGLPDDYYETYPKKVMSLTLSDVTQAAATVVDPNKQIRVVVGDREKIEPGLRELGFSEIRLMDSEGKLVK